LEVLSVPPEAVMAEGSGSGILIGLKSRSVDNRLYGRLPTSEVRDEVSGGCGVVGLGGRQMVSKRVVGA
jgi:hypothetical protein